MNQEAKNQSNVVGWLIWRNIILSLFTDVHIDNDGALSMICINVVKYFDVILLDSF